MFLDMPRLLHPVEYYAKLHPTDYAREEAERQAKEEAKRKAAEAKAAPAVEKAAPQARPVVKEKAEAPLPPSTETAEPKSATRAPEQPLVEAKDLAPEAVAQPDNLEIIEGIGPKIEELLNQHDIYTFGQLADTKVPELETILRGAGSRFQTAVPETWPRQARRAANRDWTRLDALKAQLQGGVRRPSAVEIAAVAAVAAAEPPQPPPSGRRPAAAAAASRSGPAAWPSGCAGTSAGSRPATGSTSSPS